MVKVEYAVSRTSACYDDLICNNKHQAIARAKEIYANLCEEHKGSDWIVGQVFWDRFGGT